MLAQLVGQRVDHVIVGKSRHREVDEACALNVAANKDGRFLVNGHIIHAARDTLCWRLVGKTGNTPRAGDYRLIAMLFRADADTLFVIPRYRDTTAVFKPCHNLVESTESAINGVQPRGIGTMASEPL